MSPKRVSDRQKQGALGRLVVIRLVGSGPAGECCCPPLREKGRVLGGYAAPGSLGLITSRALKTPSSSRVSICQPSFSQMRWMMVRPQP